MRNFSTTRHMTRILQFLFSIGIIFCTQHLIAHRLDRWYRSATSGHSDEDMIPRQIVDGNPFDLDCYKRFPSNNKSCRLPSSRSLDIISRHVTSSDDIISLCRVQSKTNWFQKRNRFMLVLPDDVWPYQKAGKVLDRITNQLIRYHSDTSTDNYFLPVILDSEIIIPFHSKTPAHEEKNIKMTSKESSYIPLVDYIPTSESSSTHRLLRSSSPQVEDLRRLPIDQTGELFLGPNLETYSNALLIDCFAPEEELESLSDPNIERIYIWPPIAGKVPPNVINALPSDESIRPLQSSLHGLVARQLFNHIRLWLEAWYHDPNYERVEDVGPLIWSLFNEISALKGPDHSPERTIKDFIPDLPPLPSTFQSDSPKAPTSAHHKVHLRDALWGSTPVDAPFYTSGRNDYPSDDFIAYDTPGGLLVDISRNPDLSDDSAGAIGNESGSLLVSAPSSTYGVVSIGGSLERRILQDYLWKEQGLAINHISGLDFDDEDSVRDHFSTIGESDLRKVMMTRKPVILIHSHILATKYGCDQGLDAVVIVEDDGYPLENVKRKLEETIDALQANGPDSWGYHSTGAQDMVGLRYQINTLKSSKEHSHDLATYGISALPYPVSGTFGQIINCRRFYHVLRMYFLDTDQFYLPPSQQYENYLSLHHRSPDESWKLFVADHTYENMFKRLGDRGPITPTTMSFEPIINLSPLEWAKKTRLHAKDQPGNARIEQDEFKDEDAVLEAMRTRGFPGISLINEHRRYFNLHMFITRKHICRASILDWLQYYHSSDVIEKHYNDIEAVAPTHISGIKDEDVISKFKAYLDRHVIMERAYDTLARMDRDDHQRNYYPCLVQHTVPGPFLTE